MSESDENPFRSPQTISDPALVSGAGIRREVIPFESGHRRARWTIWLLALGMFLDVAGMASTYSQVQMLEGVEQGRAVAPGEAESNDMRQGLIGIAQFGVLVGTAIAFLMWFHRAHRNLPALGSRHLKYSPGWAVGGFFVPFLNLVRPYQVMKEVWRGSDPAPASLQAGHPDDVPVSPRIGWWWALWIIMGIANQLSFRASMHAETVDALLAASWLDIGSDFISLPAALVTIFMVRGVDANQEQRNAVVSGAGARLMEDGLSWPPDDRGSGDWR